MFVFPLSGVFQLLWGGEERDLTRFLARGEEKINFLLLFLSVFLPPAR
jgi:hypothetical protein